MKKIALLITAVIIGQAVFSQDTDSTKKKSTTTITGSVDGYYRYNFNNSKTSPYNSFTSFTKTSNSFELGMASLRADHSFGKVSATIDIGFGNRAEEFAYNDASTRFAIKQAYLSYAPSAVIKFTLGTWATHVGYEMLDPYLNRNYSMSYMFSNGPFSHTGVKADISLGGKNALMLGISNPVDYRSAPAMPKSLIAQFSTASKNDKLKAYFNFVGGKQSATKKLLHGDIVAIYTVTGKFNIGLNGTLQSVQLTDTTGASKTSDWSGVALYLNFDPVNWVGLTIRGEYIADKDQYVGLKNIFAPTLSANFKIDNLTIIPEFRLDNAGNSVFYKNAGTFTKSTGSFILAATYHF
ncbi:outer membrane beta-barrel protein [Ferruginibacter sp. SUN106]|uniref:outer membrane beta-barrel protein n=1 Tax=Ferruginibacter sp. SUN106 TaxID=2978348 RepID=UPI003D3697FF